jgi:type II secretion system protein G
MYFHSNKKNKNGFTLIEVMVAVAIIGILSSVVISSVTESKKRSRDAKRISDINQMKVALELYFDRCGEYPTKPNRTSSLPNITANNGCPTGINLQTFINQLPAPPVANEYKYTINVWPGKPTDYALRADLEGNNQVLVEDFDGWTSSAPVLVGNESLDCDDGGPTPPGPKYYYCILSK